MFSTESISPIYPVFLLTVATDPTVHKFPECVTTDRTTAEKHPKKTQKDLKKTSKNRFPLYFVWEKKTQKNPKLFFFFSRPGPN